MLSRLPQTLMVCLALCHQQPATKFKLPIPGGFETTVQGASDLGVNRKNSDASATGLITFTLFSNETPFVFAAGFVQRSSISVTVFEDMNADGERQSPADSGMGELTISIRNTATDTVSSAQTNTSGVANFENLLPATYTVTVELRSNFSFSPLNVLGISESLDSDVGGDGTVNITVVSSSGVNEVTAGEFKSITILFSVFEDLDGDGVDSDGIDKPVAGVSVVLYAQQTAGVIADPSNVVTAGMDEYY